MINDCTILGVSLLKVRKVGMRAWSIVRYTQLNEEKKGKTKRCFMLLLTYTHGNVPSIAGGKATTRTYTHTCIQTGRADTDGKLCQWWRNFYFVKKPFVHIFLVFLQFGDFSLSNRYVNRICFKSGRFETRERLLIINTRNTRDVWYIVCMTVLQTVRRCTQSSPHQL